MPAEFRIDEFSITPDGVIDDQDGMRFAALGFDVVPTIGGDFELRYPPGSDANRWLPSHQPVVSSSLHRHQDGLFPDVMGDALTMYVYQIGDPVREYHYTFTGLTQADKAAFEAFQATVETGTFEIRDGDCGPITAFVKVKFAPDGGFGRRWTLLGGSRWGVQFRFRQVPE